MQWMSLADNLNPIDWGWTEQDGKFIPLMTMKSHAPESLLKMIRCSCSTGCSSMKCTCRRSGLK